MENFSIYDYFILCLCLDVIVPHSMIYYLFQYIEDNLCVMSVGFLLSGPDEAVIWRGPKKNGVFAFVFYGVRIPFLGKELCHFPFASCLSRGQLVKE